MQTTETQPTRGAAPAPAGAAPAAAGGMPSQPLTAQQVQQMQIMSKQAMGLLLEDQTAEQIVLAAQQGDPQQLGERIRRVYLDGDGTQPGGPYAYEECRPYTGPTHAPYVEGRVGGKAAWRALLKDIGAHERGTMHVPRLVVGGTTATATGWAGSTASGVDVAAKLAELEQRIAALEA